MVRTCKWGTCEQMFANQDQLMQHITQHVYTCPPTKRRKLETETAVEPPAQVLAATATPPVQQTTITDSSGSAQVTGSSSQSRSYLIRLPPGEAMLEEGAYDSGSYGPPVDIPAPVANDSSTQSESQHSRPQTQTSSNEASQNILRDRLLGSQLPPPPSPGAEALRPEVQLSQGQSVPQSDHSQAMDTSEGDDDNYRPIETQMPRASFNYASDSQDR